MGISKLQFELIKFFKSGIKTEHKKNIGLEVEHFIVYEDSLEAVPYEGAKGVRYIVKELMKFYHDSKPLICDDLIGFSTHSFNVTLEPAAQIEISIAPFEDLKIIDEIYSKFLDNIKLILQPLKYRVLSVGCHPVSKTENLSLIPKKRYKLMDMHFKNIGTSGNKMMKNTCSTQVSIDYFSEEDFRKKFQAAYLFTPALKLLSNNSTHFEGQALNTYLKRTEIWNNTDPIRCQIPPNIFSESYSFKDYAIYLCKIPPIFINDSEHTLSYTKSLNADDVFMSKVPNKNDILHIVSIAFPDVRLKNYLEIRVADSMSKDYVLAYCLLVKGLFYSDYVLNWCQEFIRSYKITIESIIDSQNDLIKYGWGGSIYGFSAREFITKVLDLARMGLSEFENSYLKLFGNF